MTQTRSAALMLVAAAAWGLLAGALAGEPVVPAPPEPPEPPPADVVIEMDQVEAEDKEFELRPRTEPPLELALLEAVELALGYNFDLQVERLNPELRGADVEINRAEFDPTIGVDGTTNLEHGPSTGGSSDSYSSDGDAYFSQKIRSGADYRLSSSMGRSGGGTYTSGLNLTVTQPLFRNFGFDANWADIETAENELAIAESRLVGKLIETVGQVHRDYWDLVLACRTVDVRRIALEQAKELLRENIDLRKGGMAIKTDVLQAYAKFASRRVALVRAEAAIREAEDRLKAITNIAAADQDATDTWQRPLTPTTEAPFVEIEPDQLASIGEAIDNRPDLFEAKTTLENRGIALRYAKNQLYPQLDVTASAGLTGSGGLAGTSVDEMLGKSHSRWSLGATVSYPLGNRSRRHTHRKREIEQQQSLLNLKALEQTIILEVRRAVRNVETDLRRVKAARIAVASAEENLKAAQEMKKAGLGRITTHDILLFQEDLESVRLNQLNAIVDYNKSLIGLDEAKGVLLRSQGIRLERE